MKFWLTTIGEPLPTDGSNVRLLRHGLLAEMLLEQGHQVDWWTSAWDHQQKRWRCNSSESVSIAHNFRVHFIRGTGYRKNVSFSRLKDHRVVSEEYQRAISSELPPELILSSFPTAGLCNASVEYGKKHGVPVVVDVRDMWPDIFFDLFPRPLQKLARVCAIPMTRENAIGLRAADAIVSMSEACLDWGLNTAQRDRTDIDTVFPLAYHRHDVAPAECQQATTSLTKMGIDPKKTVCWYIGTLGKRYDIPTIIESARLLQATNDDTIQFVISGDGDQSSKLRQQAAGLKNIVFTGWIQTPEIAAMMSIASIGLVALNDALPTLPNKLFEYFSAGIPVASCVEGEAAQLIASESCGFSYSRHDAKGLMSVLHKLSVETQLRKKFGLNAKRLYEENYSSKAVYGQMIAHLLKIHESFRSTSCILNVA